MSINQTGCKKAVMFLFVFFVAQVTFFLCELDGFEMKWKNCIFNTTFPVCEYISASYATTFSHYNYQFGSENGLRPLLFTLPRRKMRWRERKRRYRHAPTRPPLEIDSRPLTAASTAAWVAVLSSAPTHKYTLSHTRTLSEAHNSRTWGGLPLVSQMLS